MHSRHKEQHVLRHLAAQPDVLKLLLCPQFSLWLGLVLYRAKEKHSLFLGPAGHPSGDWPEHSSPASEDSLHLSVPRPESRAVTCKWLFPSLPKVSPDPPRGQADAPARAWLNHE